MADILEEIVAHKRIEISRFFYEPQFPLKYQPFFSFFLFKIKTLETSDGIAGNGGTKGAKGLRLFLPFYPFTFLLLKALFTFNY